MPSWEEFAAEAPEVVAVAAALWPGIVALNRLEVPRATGDVFDIAYLASVRRDGGPRLHPFCPVLAAGRLFAAIPRSSPKGWDLRRDPRCVIHALPGVDDAELCIRALASEVTDDDLRAVVRGTVERGGIGGMTETVSNDPLFEFDLQQVDVARWLDVGQPGTRAERRRWRATTALS